MEIQPRAPGDPGYIPLVRKILINPFTSIQPQKIDFRINYSSHAIPDSAKDLNGSKNRESLSKRMRSISDPELAIKRYFFEINKN
jgi:hypothetical protein